jgi:uncharacterized delta-60 repeat protein
MATNRLFAYSTTSINGSSQSGNLAISTSAISGHRWWPGPDEDLGYVIAHDDVNPNMRTEGSRSATVSTNSVGFWRSAKTSEAFLTMVNDLFNVDYSSAPLAAYWLNTNGYWTSYSPEQPFSSKSFITGGFTSYNGTSTNGLIKLNYNGTIDNTFIFGTGLSHSSYNFNSHSVLIQSDDKILVGGNFTSYNGTSRNNIIRLNTDGTIDSGFTIGTGFDGLLLKIKTQTDGKIIAVGGFTLYNGVASREIIRLNSDGTIDNTFSVGTGFNSSLVYDVGIQSDGKIIAGGVFTEYNGTSSPRIVRLNSNGTVDNGFIVGKGFNNNVFSLAIQSDGKVLVGGQFTSYNDITYKGIVRLNSDGSVDSGFTIGTGFVVDVRNIKIQSDGKIIAVGNFTSYNETSINRIIRLNSDGTIDNGFNVGTGFNFFPYDLKIQPDGKVIVIGNFTSYNETNCNGIIRLNPDGSIDSGFTIGSGFNFTIGSAPSGIN